MANPVIATFLSLTLQPPRAADDRFGSQPLIALIDNGGRRVNESRVRRRAGAVSRQGLVHWSSTQHRYKPVTGAVIEAAWSAAAEVNRNANLVRAAIKVESNFVESNFNPSAVSRRGAMWLMQWMPSAARQLKVTNPFGREQKVDAGVCHLKSLLENYRVNVSLTLTAYNAAEGAVASSSGIPRIAKTGGYVRRITALYNRGSSSDLPFTGASRRPVPVRRGERELLYLSNTDSHRPLFPGRRQSGSTSMAGAEQCGSGREPEWKQNGESPA